MDKKNRSIIIISILSLTIILIGVTYAYFGARIMGLENASTISLNSGKMIIQYSEETANVSAQHIYPREEAWIDKKFTITGTNTVNLTMGYSAGLDISTNTFPNNYLTYDLTVDESTNGTPISEKNGAVINGTGTLLFGRGMFTSANNDRHSYDLKIYFKDNGKNQNDAQKAIFNASVIVTDSLGNDLPLYKETFTINYDTCLTQVADDFPEQSDRETLCSGGIVNDYLDMEQYIRSWKGMTMAEAETSGLITITGIEEVDVYEVDYGYAYSPDQYEYTFSCDRYSGEEDDAGQEKDRCLSGHWDAALLKDVPDDEEITAFASSIGGAPVSSIQYGYALGNKAIDFSKIDTSSVTSFYMAFDNTERDSLSLDGINTSNATDMSSMFNSSKIPSLDISDLDTSKTAAMSYMFSGGEFDSLDLSSFDTSNVNNMSGMFNNTKIANKTLDVSNFDTSKVENMGSMFSWCNLNSLDVSNFDTSNVIDMSSMFFIQQLNELDLSNFNTSNVVNMRGMFQNAAIKNLNISSFNTSKVSSMADMFMDSIIDNLDLSNFNTSNVYNFSHMFDGAKLPNNLDLSNFNTLKAYDMDYMFAGANIDTLDLSSFDTSNTQNYRYMFMGSIINTLNLSNFSFKTNASYLQMFASATIGKIYAKDNATATAMCSSTTLLSKNTSVYVNGSVYCKGTK